MSVIRTTSEKKEIKMRFLFVLILLGLCVSLTSGCCNNGVLSEPNMPDSPNTREGAYLTRDSKLSPEIYVTTQKIEGVNYQWIEPGTGEYSDSGYHYGEMEIQLPYATKWSDGTVTLTIAPFEDVDDYYAVFSFDEDVQSSVLTAEYNDTTFVSNGNAGGEAEGTEPDYWYDGTAPSGRTRSDYSTEIGPNGKYTYNGNSNNTILPSSNIDDDSDEDTNGDITVNDGVNIIQ
ncbi:MAG: hypothetical protein LBC74_07755 [Planctomycetaceae bacterium]|nr:hypothetical protein [Planctomycetaceae bacterium]